MFKPISLTAALCLGLFSSYIHAEEVPNTKKPTKQKKKKKPKKDIYSSTKKIESSINTVHPLFALESIDTLGNQDLKIGGMCFDGEALYVATLSPDRTNKSPDHQGKVLRIENVLSADGKESTIKVSTVVTGLYEPCAITVVEGHVYVGTKTQILRFDHATKSENEVKSTEGVVLLDGTSTINFHTYTIGFEKYIKDGKTYLSGNFTTAIRVGGKRDKMIPSNPKVHRGSTFILGPITGSETAESLELEYLAGGFRTPNGIEVGPDNEVYVADNQGIFNPSNELIRVEPGSFYGHYLLTDQGRAAAFQPTDYPAEKGSPLGQKPATVHLPQGSVARSPAQPHVIRNRKGVLAPYNGQILLCEFTTGSLLRVYMEQVEGTWQGVAFKHSGGPAKQDGTGGFTAGPNRIEEGPDGNYYIGQIGAGRLWEFNGRAHGLQRLRVKSPQEVDANFNEVLTVKTVDKGFEVEFLQPLAPDIVLKPEQMKVSQWTYTPTSDYGGNQQNTETLTVSAIKHSEDRKKVILTIEGLKDGSDEFVIKSKKGTSHNTGWVVHVQLTPGADQTNLYTNEFWYTLHKKIGGTGDGGSLVVDPIILAKQKYETLCSSCHEPPAGTPRAAPELRGILGRKQMIVTKDGKEVETKINRAYLVNAIIDPDAVRPLEFKDVPMAQLGIQAEEAEALVEYIISLKKKK